MQLSRVGLWRWYPNTREMHWSAGMCALAGLPHQTSRLSFNEVASLLTSASALGWEQALQQMLAQQTGLECQLSLRSAQQPGCVRVVAEVLQGDAHVIEGSAEWLPDNQTSHPEQLLHALPIGILEVNAEGGVLFINQTLQQWLGISGAKLQDLPMSELFDTVNARLLDGLLDAAMTGSTQPNITLQLQQRRELAVGCQESTTALTGRRSWYLIMHDVTVYAELTQQLRQSEERWQLALESSGDGVWDWYPQTGIEILSDRLKAIYGYEPNEIEDLSDELDRRTHPDDLEQMQADRQAHFDGLTPTYINEHRVQCKDGRWKWILTRGTVIERDAQGDPVRVVGTHTDISERKQAEADVRDSEERLRMALSATHQGLYDLNVKTGTAIVNDDYALMLGYPLEQFSENRQNWLRRLHPEDLAPSERAFRDYINGKAQEYRAEFRQKHANGSWVWILSVGALVEWDDQGNPLRMLGTVLDITARKQSEAIIWQQANIDPLTGLPNRRMFYDRLEQNLRQSKRRNSLLAVLFIDLDFFKEVNDTLGHATGDSLLVEAAKRLRLCVRETDTVARLGGDEFTVSLPDQSDTVQVEQIARKIIEQLASPFHVAGEEIYLSASIGITLYPRDADNLADLIKHADQAMYAAKAAGRNRFSYFTPNLQTAALARLRLNNELRSAISDKQLQVYFQPIVETESGIIRKAEALIRWYHPQKGWISPLEFIPIAESSGQIHAIGELVFLEAVRWVSQWRKTIHPDFQISINQSPVEFQNENSPYSSWIAYLEQQGLPGQAINIEITEGLLLDADNKVASHLIGFRDAGIQVAIDDFGTGYSALSYLKKFDIDYLKIDQSFVRNLRDNSSDMALCEAIIMMAHKLGLQVVAEGVENAEQEQLLRSAKCDFVQGYLYSKPLSASDFDHFLLQAASKL
ncbi:GGDEF and EAL domain-containing protein [Undibacterium crateris]|uniref:GGDEF and EAL domain-containing protein n=1 Tax=Undibacterium crateris TaxID=2528175 RepID=UPI00138A31B2|nr:GGDEF and EAL domain-containing protein [Undibacterium crateris]NDI84771.1 EAL domain-containing protein [Undibacterium crateris]